MNFSVFALMGLLSIAAYYFAKRCHFFSCGPRKRPPLNTSTFLGGILLFLGMNFIVFPGLVWAYFYLKTGSFHPEFQLNKQSQFILPLIASFLMFSVLLLYNAILSKRSFRAIWGGGNHNFNHFLFGAATWFLAFPMVSFIGECLTVFVSWAFDVVPKDQVAVGFIKKTFQDPLLFFAASIMVAVFVPTIEEFIFRGCLQSWLTGKIGRRLGILIASLIFALFHFSFAQGVANIQILASLFFLSCILGYIYERQDSLFASIGLHAMFNAMTIVFLYFGFE